MGLHQFGMGQHASAAWKMLKDRTNQNKVIAGAGAAPSLDDVATLMATDGVYLMDTPAMEWGCCSLFHKTHRDYNQFAIECPSTVRC